MSNNVARGTILGIASQAWHLVTAFLLYGFLARQLGPATFGNWRLVLSVLAWFEIFLTSGLFRVTTKAIAEKPAEQRRITSAAYLGQSAVAVVIFGAVVVAAGPVATALSYPSLAPLIRIAALDIPFYAMFMVATSVLLGEQRFERQAVVLLIYATAKFAAIAGLVALGFSVQGALVGNALSSVVGIAVAFVPWARSHERLAELKSLAITMLVSAVPFLAMSLVEGVGQSADLWLVSAIVPDRVHVGWYASAVVLAEVPVFLFAGLDRVIFPSVARALAEGDAWLAARYARQGVRLALMMPALAVAIVAGTGMQVLQIVFGESFAGAVVPLIVLMGAAAGRTVRQTCTEILLARGRRRTAIAILVGTIGLEVVLLSVLATTQGLVGAAAAAAAAAVIGATLAAWTIRDMLGIRPVVTLLRSAVAAAAVGAALAYASPSLPALLVAYPLAVVVYAGILGLLGEFDREDFASIRAAVGR